MANGKLIEWIPGAGARSREPIPTPDPGGLTVATPAVDTNGDPWLYVEYVADESFEYDLHVGFSDDFAFAHDGAIEGAASFLGSLPGVTGALRQDPDQILVTGTRDAVRIRDSLIGYFAAIG